MKKIANDRINKQSWIFSDDTELCEHCYRLEKITGEGEKSYRLNWLLV